MASYFDLPAQSNAPAPSNEPKEEQEKLRGTGLLTPQISRLLDDLLFDDKSSSSDGDEEDNSSSSVEEEVSRPSYNRIKDRNSSTRSSRLGREELDPEDTAITTHGPKPSAKSTTKVVKLPPGRTTGGKPLKSPRSHMTRFQSLRSTLFQAHIEDNMKKCHQEVQTREEAATNWKAQHEKRQGYNRPKTPEKAPDEKDGFGHRIGMKIRRLTSKEPPTLASIEENTGNLIRRESTASDDDGEPHGAPWKPRQSYESSIDHSDVDELVRWVSRRDPPSDGERKTSTANAPKKEDSGHESLGHSDIEDLVSHARGKKILTESVMPEHSGYSDESTASDSEQSQEDDDQDEDSLSRWISRRDGAHAGPVRHQPLPTQIEPDTDIGSDVPEIGRWRTHHDNTSGESIAGDEFANKDDISVLETARGRSKQRSPKIREKNHLGDDDVEELVRWVSRQGSKPTSSPDIKNEITALKRQEDGKKQ